jgi:hypothetical protein
MLSCKAICQIVSESLDAKLPLHKRISVRIHLLMCKACQRMAHQMELLREAASRHESDWRTTQHSGQETLSKEASTRILSRLRQAEQHSTDN